jgi:cytidine deaminase
MTDEAHQADEGRAVDLEALARAAREVAEYAYSPYSHVQVGAALQAKDGRVFLGCNVENASFGATICAERAALVTAVAAGAREFVALSIWGSPKARLMPCGMCRQMLVEFGTDLVVQVESRGTGRETYSLAELMPGAVVSDSLR